MSFLGRVGGAITGGLTGFVASGFNPLGAGAGAVAGAMRGGGGGGGGGSAEEQAYRRRFGGIVDDYAGRYPGADRKYMADLEGFDPGAGFAAATKADLDAYDEKFARDYSDRIGSMVGQGRSPAYNGFGLRDAQDTVDEGMRIRGQIRQQGEDDLTRARMSMLGMRGDYIRGGMDRYAGMVGDRMNTMEGQRMTDAASKRSMWGQLAGAVATGAGAYFGNRRETRSGLARDTF